MEKNQSSFRPQCGVYGRIKKAITFGNPPEPSPPSPPPLNYPNSPEYPKASTKPVPIEFDHSVFSEIKKKRPVHFGQNDKVVRTTGGVESAPEVVEGNKSEQQAGGNNQFSEYIRRAKMKMRRNMTVIGSDDGSGGRGKGVSRLESINKNMSAYMDRAKVKMKNSSIVGSGKKPD